MTPNAITNGEALIKPAAAAMLSVQSNLHACDTLGSRVTTSKSVSSLFFCATRVHMSATER